MVNKEVRTTDVVSDDEELVRQSQIDPEAFRLLYEKYFKKIFQFVYHRVGDRALTADVTSQVFLKALLSLGKFQFRGLPFSAWLFRIAINECHDFFRRNKRYRMVAIEDAGVEHLCEEMMFSSTESEELHTRLPEILQELNKDELMIIELRFFDQHSYRDIGEMLGITETYAKVRTYRILTKMKDLFLQLR